jgi:signal transduction histidine kinase
MKVLMTGILFYTISISCLGQINNRTLFTLNDSLKLELEKPHNDSVKAYILLRIAENFLSINPDSAILYSEKSIRFAENAKQLHIKLGSMGFLATAIMFKGNLPRALETGLNAIELAKNIPSNLAREWLGPTYFTIGDIYLQIDDFKKASTYYTMAINLSESDYVGISWGYFSMAKVYEKLNSLDSAMIMLDKAHLIFNKVDYSLYQNIYDFNAGWYELRAKIYLKQNKPELALKDLFGTLKMTSNNGLFFHTSNINNDIADYYKSINQTDSAIYCAEKGLEVAGKVSYTQGILKASGILAELYELNNPEKALYHYKLNAEIRNNLYGAGNIQIMSDMIAQNEKKQVEIETAKVEYQNRIRLNSILGITFTLLLIAIFMFIISRRKQKANLKIQKAYSDLKSTQAQLIQSEKMASLGELTAGIAHEIQNPLNFVNNFSELSKELIGEMNEELAEGSRQYAAGSRQSGEEKLNLAKEIAGDISQNLEKINHHGKRAADIVKGMLQHSRTSSGQKEPTDINALADEYLRLAYHGLRAKDKTFNADYKTEFDESLPKINVIPQDIGRVLLNLINNAFYAVNEKVKLNVNDYKPLVVVTTKLTENYVKIIVQDNGNGIPDLVKEKIFQPFFTTKPTGSGTGLGLSLSYDIVKAHNGEIKVETKVREGSEFILTLKYNNELI